MMEKRNSNQLAMIMAKIESYQRHEHTLNLIQFIVRLNSSFALK